MNNTRLYSEEEEEERERARIIFLLFILSSPNEDHSEKA